MYRIEITVVENGQKRQGIYSQIFNDTLDVAHLICRLNEGDFSHCRYKAEVIEKMVKEYE